MLSVFTVFCVGYLLNTAVALVSFVSPPRIHRVISCKSSPSPRETTASVIAADFLAAARKAATDAIKESSEDESSSAVQSPPPVEAENHEAWSKLWDEQFLELREIFIEGGRIGNNLETWVNKQLKAEAKGELSEERARRLQALTEYPNSSFDWVGEESREAGRSQWSVMYECIRSYREINGDCLVPVDLDGHDLESSKTKNDDSPLPPLGAWVSSQRRAHARGGLTYERITALNYLDFDWFVVSEISQGQPEASAAPPSWSALYELLRRFRFEKGNCDVPRSCVSLAGVRIGLWVQDLREARRLGELSSTQIARLDFLDFNWDDENKASITMGEVFDLN